MTSNMAPSLVVSTHRVTEGAMFRLPHTAAIAPTQAKSAEVEPQGESFKRKLTEGGEPLAHTRDVGFPGRRARYGSPGSGGVVHGGRRCRVACS